jgi:hypothetical protein
MSYRISLRNKGSEMSYLIDWLFDVGDPTIQCRTLVELLDRPSDDPEVQAAQAIIPDHPPLAALLTSQKPAGYWIQRDFYIPKHFSTFWVLSLLADLGLSNENDHIQRGVGFMFSQQRPDGGFCRQRRVSGKGLVRDEQSEPCTQARIVRFLIQFGYGRDPRTRLAIEWLLAAQRPDAMWLCSHARGRGCLRATLDFLRAAALDPDTAIHPATARAALVVANLLLEPKMGRYHVGNEWLTLTYPYFGYSLIGALDALARFGFTPAHAKIADSAEYLLSRRLPDGSWPLDERARRCPLDFGEPDKPNPWLTLEALVALKRLGLREL